MQSSKSGGWDWTVNDTVHSGYSGPINAMAGHATLCSHEPIMSGRGANALLSLTPKARPYYLETWAAANFGHELQKPFWTDDEFVAILLGLNPMFARFEDLALNKDAKATEGMRLHELVRRAVLIGELSAQPSPVESIDWALGRHIPVPDKLIEIAVQRDLPLVHCPSRLDMIISEYDAETQRLCNEIEELKALADRRATSSENSRNLLEQQCSKNENLKKQLTEARAEARDAKPENRSAATRKYRTVVKLLFVLVSKNYGFSFNNAKWNRTKLETDLAEHEMSVDDETLLNHLRAGSEQASR